MSIAAGSNSGSIPSSAASIFGDGPSSFEFVTGDGGHAGFNTWSAHCISKGASCCTCMMTGPN
jgi:hypothetical protein